MENEGTLKAIAKPEETAKPEWIWILILIGIAIGFRNYFNGLELSLEELLGIVAVTTFLVGFSSVRIQSSLESWKESSSRLINRVLEQNANDDLLPLPTNFIQYNIINNSFEPRDNATKMTSALTWSTLIISSYLIFMHHRYGGEITDLVLIQIIHLAIVVTGSFEPKFALQISQKWRQRQPFDRYKELEEELRKFLTIKGETDKKSKDKVIKAVERLDESLPSWCWLYLIRCDLDPEKVKSEFGTQLGRLCELAKKSKHFDDFSHIVFVWSTYLLEPDIASLLIRYMDIQRVMKFSKQTGDIYAEMALRCVYKAWNPTKAEPNAPTSMSESAETDQSPLTVLGNHLKKTRDIRLKVLIP